MSLIITDQSGSQYSLSVNSADGSLSVTPTRNVSPSSGDNSIFVSALDLITRALRLIGVTAAGEYPTADESGDALLAFQDMIDSWNADRLTIFSIGYADYALTLNKQSYTLGPGGDFNANRPARIVGISAILMQNPSNPIEVPVTMYTAHDWQTHLPVKNVPGNFPQICYDDGGMPLRTLNLWPIPIQQNNLRIYSWSPLIWPAKLTTVLNLPPGYAEAVRYNLALRLGAEFGAEISQIVAGLAVSTLAQLKTMNAPELTLVSDLIAVEPGYNYRADLFGIA